MNEKTLREMIEEKKERRKEAIEAAKKEKATSKRELGDRLHHAAVSDNGVDLR